MVLVRLVPWRGTGTEGTLVMNKMFPGPEAKIDVEGRKNSSQPRKFWQNYRNEKRFRCCENWKFWNRGSKAYLVYSGRQYFRSFEENQFQRKEKKKQYRS